MIALLILKHEHLHKKISLIFLSLIFLRAMVLFRGRSEND